MKFLINISPAVQTFISVYEGVCCTTFDGLGDSIKHYILIIDWLLFNVGWAVVFITRTHVFTNNKPYIGKKMAPVGINPWVDVLIVTREMEDDGHRWKCCLVTGHERQFAFCMEGMYSPNTEHSCSLCVGGLTIGFTLVHLVDTPWQKDPSI